MKITTNVNKCRFVWCRTFFCRALYSAIDRSRHQTATWFWRWIYFLKLFSFWSHTAPSSFCHTFIQSGYRVCFSRNNFGISKVLIYWCDDCIIFVLIRLNVFLKIFFFLVFFGESKSGWLFFVQISQYFEKQKSYVRNWSEHLLSNSTWVRSQTVRLDRPKFTISIDLIISSRCECVHYDHCAICVWFFQSSAKIWKDK